MPVDEFHSDTIFKGAQEVLTAKNRRLQLLRTSMLFSAIAAEAFANEFVDDTLGRNMAGTLDKLSTVDKLIVGAQLVAGNASPLDKGRQPMQDIAGLATTRDRLVHPKEKGGIAAWTQHVTQDDENRVGAAAAERAILAVVDLVVVCNPLQKHPNLHGGAAKRISMERKLLSAHGKKVGTLLGDLPSKEEAGTLPLFTQMEMRGSAACRSGPRQAPRPRPSPTRDPISAVHTGSVAACRHSDRACQGRAAVESDHRICRRQRDRPVPSGGVGGSALALGVAAVEDLRRSPRACVSPTTLVAAGKRSMNASAD